MIKTEAGEKMKEENPIDGIDTIDGRELLRQELEKEGKKFGMPEMNCGGLMGESMGVIIGIEEESGNEIPAGSMAKEVADDIPAMLSEGEYVVPADVVRWHGVKTFEALRGEAKMGMGLMAQDGRIAEVESEEHEYEIEEKDKPKVEKAEVKVVEAAEGIIAMPEAPDPVVPARYRLVQEIDPETGRIVYVYRDPVTGETVTPEEFKPQLSTRMSPGEIVQREVYGKEYKECGEGFVYDPDTDTCVPVAPDAVAEPTVGGTMAGGDGGDGPAYEGPFRTDYVNQPLTKLAEKLGPLTAEDLENVEGETLAEKAVTRMTTPATPVSTGGFGLLGLAVTGVQNLSDNIGARRAAITRANEFTNDPLGVKAYNFNFDPATGSFKTGKPSTQVTETQTTSGGGSWATDYDHVGASGKSYSSDDVFSNDDAFNDVMDAIDSDFGGMTAVSGSPGRGPSGVSVSVTTGDNSMSSTSSTSSAGGGGGIGGTDSSGDVDSSDSGGGSAADSAAAGADASGSPGTSDSAADADSADSGWAKGGYISKKNKPKMATMQYSKGSK